MKIYLESLGCARNQIDSEVMLGRLVAAGMVVVETPEHADVMIVNTCSFIADAADESIDTIMSLAQVKKAGKPWLLVAGCLPERYQANIADTLPEVDLFMGTGGYDHIVDIVRRLVNDDLRAERCFFPDPDLVSPEKSHLQRIPIESSPVAYVKVAEGCNRHCTYCIIPKLRGRYRSRTIPDIQTEVLSLVSTGTREILFVAESTTDYGVDSEGTDDIACVLKAVSDITKVRLRLMYTFPDTVTDRLIDLMHQTESICSYFDVPIQHASDSVLKRMGRQYSQSLLLCLFEKIRAKNPESALRTTVITGFPGETEADFDQLLTFIKTVKFDHLGVFTYSDSDDLPSHYLDNHVPESVALRRQDILMATQADISLARNRLRVGQSYRVLIEEQVEDGIYTGRTEFQAPEVDGVVFVYAQGITPGDYCDVLITDAYEYDLAGELI